VAAAERDRIAAARQRVAVSQRLMAESGSEPGWEQVAELEGHTGQVLSVGWSPDGSLLASAGYDGSVRVWAEAR